MRSPTGDSYCALICAPSAVSANSVNGKCSKGATQAIIGADSCTLAALEVQQATVAEQFLVALEVEANPVHYDDPATGSESGDPAMQVPGASGDLSSP